MGRPGLHCLCVHVSVCAWWAFQPELWDMCHLKEVVLVLSLLWGGGWGHCYVGPLIFMGTAYSDTVACQVGRGQGTSVWGALLN